MSFVQLFKLCGILILWVGKIYSIWCWMQIQQRKKSPLQTLHIRTLGITQCTHIGWMQQALKKFDNKSAHLKIILPTLRKIIQPPLKKLDNNSAHFEWALPARTSYLWSPTRELSAIAPIDFAIVYFVFLSSVLRISVFRQVKVYQVSTWQSVYFVNVYLYYMYFKCLCIAHCTLCKFHRIALNWCVCTTIQIGVCLPPLFLDVVYLYLYFLS